jgi:hypothetical protein
MDRARVVPGGEFAVVVIIGAGRGGRGGLGILRSKLVLFPAPIVGLGLLLP